MPLEPLEVSYPSPKLQNAEAGKDKAKSYQLSLQAPRTTQESEVQIIEQVLLPGAAGAVP